MSSSIKAPFYVYGQISSAIVGTITHRTAQCIDVCQSFILKPLAKLIKAVAPRGLSGIAKGEAGSLKLKATCQGVVENEA